MHSIMIAVLLFFISLHSCGQAMDCCDTIYSNPVTAPTYKDGEAGLMKYIRNSLLTVYNDCYVLEGDVITRQAISLTIDCNGKVREVEFVRTNLIGKTELSELCRGRLKRELLKMNGWTAAQLRGQNICSKFLIPISCILWKP
jgi:hypothetical protein